MSRTVVLALVSNLLLFSSAEAERSHHRRGLLHRTGRVLRVLVSPVSVSRARNGDLRVAKRGLNGVLSITRYRRDGRVRRLERQLVQQKDGMLRPRTVAWSGRTRIRGLWRAGLERAKAVGSSPIARASALNFGGIFGLTALGTSTAVAAVVTNMGSTTLAYKAPHLFLPPRRKIRRDTRKMPHVAR